MADLLPNISVTLNQIKATSGSVRVPINATVILKAKSGPIGELTKIGSYTEAVKIFGLGDSTTPALYGVEQYLKTYNYVNLIRVASNSAAEASVELKVSGEEPGPVIPVYVEVDTETTPFDPNETYYVLDEETANYKVAKKTVVTYNEVDQSTAVFDPAETYYIKNASEEYEEVTITEFDPEVTYYTKTVTEEPITEFEDGVTYYILTEEPTPGPLGVIISGKSVYKTDIYNGDEIKLVYNIIRNRLSLSGTLNGTTYTTPLELIDLDTATADELEVVLNKLVKNWNALNTGMVLENKFVNKTAADPTLTSTDIVKGTIQLGDSGNEGEITNADIIALLNIIEDPTVETQDVVMVPEFRNYEIVNYGTSLRNAYFYIVAATGTALADKQDAIANYNPSDKGVLYTPSGCYMGDDSIIVPFEVAALYAWATTYNVNRYYAPAGVKRGVLNPVSQVVDNLSDIDAQDLYNGDVPANPIKYLTNYGFTLYGQKTMDASQVFTNRINVSNLVNYIKIQGNLILQPYLFEYTPISTFQKVYLDLDKMLSGLATQEILYDDYQIVCDTSNNTKETLANHELHAALAIRPVNVTEYIYLDLTVTDELGGEA